VSKHAASVLITQQTSARTRLAREVAGIAFDLLAGEALKRFVGNVKSFSADASVFGTRNGGE
jgi:hypothetical protein